MLSRFRKQGEPRVRTGKHPPVAAWRGQPPSIGTYASLHGRPRLGRHNHSALSKKSPSHACNPTLYVHFKQSLLTLCTVNCRTQFPFRRVRHCTVRECSALSAPLRVASRSRSVAHILAQHAYRGSAPHLAALFYLFEKVVEPDQPFPQAGSNETQICRCLMGKLADYRVNDSDWRLEIWLRTRTPSQLFQADFDPPIGDDR